MPETRDTSLKKKNKEDMIMGKIEDFLKTLFPSIFNVKEVKYLSGKKSKE
jgi:hypothetical protein